MLLPVSAGYSGKTTDTAKTFVPVAFQKVEIAKILVKDKEHSLK